MTDVHSKQTRSYNMSMIKGKNTKPEIIVRKYLFSKGFRFRINVKKLPGSPDIVLKKYKTIILINGCFWHGHENCKDFVLPKTNTQMWKNKIDRNRERDFKNRCILRSLGWNIINVWGCQLKGKKKQDTLEEISNLLYQILLNQYRL